MRVLLVGDASNFHNTLARALRKMGHDVVVISDGSKWMDTDRDINLYRRGGRLGAVRYVLDLLKSLPKMKGFDVVHIVNPIFLKLRPAKVRLVFDYLKRNNRSIFLSALGSDYDYVKACMEGRLLKYSEYMVGDKPTAYLQSAEGAKERKESWLTEEMQEHHRHVIENVDGAVACLYEYWKVYNTIIPDKLAYAGIPIETSALKPIGKGDVPEKVKFFIGIQRNRSIYKGTDKLLEAAQRVVAKYPDRCELDVVENVPYKEYVSRMARADVMLDQLYSYTPATNAMIAMAQGLVAVSGGEDEYYDFIGENENRPIVNVTPEDADDIERKLEWIVNNRAKLPQMSRQSRAFVVKHIDSEVVAQRHVEFWNQILAKKR